MKKKIIRLIFLSTFFCLFSLNSVVNLFAFSLNSLVYEQTAEIPIIMYHNISNNKSMLNKYGISAEEFEDDLKYLKENGYETIFMSDLIDFVHKSKKLPDKPIILTFDDGSFSIDKYALPLLEEYNMKAVVSIIGKVTDEYSKEDRCDIQNYPNLTWAQINTLIDSGCFEIQNHTYDLHKNSGAIKMRGESEEAYKIRLIADIEKLQNRIYEMTQTSPTTFAYPFGSKSSSSDEIIKEIGFLASLSCDEKINAVKIGDEDCLFSLGRFVRPHNMGIGKIVARFEG